MSDQAQETIELNQDWQSALEKTCKKGSKLPDVPEEARPKFFKWLNVVSPQAFKETYSGNSERLNATLNKLLSPLNPVDEDEPALVREVYERALRQIVGPGAVKAGAADGGGDNVLLNELGRKVRAKLDAAPDVLGSKP
eukprot:gene4525-4778_t